MPQGQHITLPPDIHQHRCTQTLVLSKVIKSNHGRFNEQMHITVSYQTINQLFVIWKLRSRYADLN